MAIFPKEAPSLYVLGPVSLSRDGKRIAVELDRSPVVVKRGADSVVQESRSAIAVIDLVSSRMHVLASEKTDHRSPSLSADGRLIAFAASGGGERAVVVADMEAGTARSFDPGGEPVEVAISADGNTLAYSARSTNDLDLFAADLRAGTRHLISDRPGDDSLSSISADGTRVAFAGEVFGDREILLADLRAGTIRDISRREGKDDFPRISADGRRIVFSGLMGESRQLFFADVETGLVKTLSGSDAWDYGPSISGDGKKVLFISGGQIFGTVRFLQVD